MKTAYFDCSSGISGDMILGALVDSGLPISKLSKELKLLPIRGYFIKTKKTRRANIAATKVDVIVNTPQKPLNSISAIKSLINKSSLPPKISKQAIDVFLRIAKAEAHAHGIPTTKVVFHEIGVIDTLVDVVGSLLGCALLEIDQIITSPINLGSGIVKTSHGNLSIPTPATAELLKGIPVYTSEINCELTTPTGAALITSLSKKFGTMPQMSINTIGHGAGTFKTSLQPNILRVLIGNSEEIASTDLLDSSQNDVVMIESNIDDMNPQIYDSLIQLLLKFGALDVTLTPVLMKQGRPGIILSVLSKKTHVDTITEIIYRETTTLGVRLYNVSRKILQRTHITLKTKYGTVSVKVATLNDGKKRHSLEYRDCKTIAEKTGIPLRDIMDEVQQILRDTLKKPRVKKGKE